jgi:hypothetical protein
MGISKSGNPLALKSLKKISLQIVNRPNEVGSGILKTDYLHLSLTNLTGIWAGL